MQVPVKKFLFIGSEKDRARFFEEAQKLGQIEFIKFKEQLFTKKPESVRQFVDAIKIVLEYPPLRQVPASEIPKTPAKLASQIVRLHNKFESLLEEKRLLRLEISRIEPFGDFSLEDLDFIEKEGGRTLQFFTAKKGKFLITDETPEIILVNCAHGLDYFVAINREHTIYKGLIEMQIDHALGELLSRLDEVNRLILLTESYLKQNAKYNECLHDALVEEVNRHNLHEQRDDIDSVVEGSIFSVEGWVAKSQLKALKKLTEKMAIHAEEVVIEKNDKVPTYLSNKGTARIGEDLINIYDTPCHSDMDTSPFVLWSFAFFFAMILSDGGYGLLFLGTALFMRYKFKGLRGFKNRIVNLIVILSTFCILWGGITNSFFGIQFAIDSPVRKFSLLQFLAEKKASYHMSQKDVVYKNWLKKYPEVKKAKTPKEFLQTVAIDKGNRVEYKILEKFLDSVRLEIALLIGVLHISLAFLLAIRRSWSGVGWILFMIGGYLYFAEEVLHATSLLNFVFGVSKAAAAREGMIMLYSGIGLAVVLAFLQKGLRGASEVTKVIQVFSDVLSYLRIYALGLAGGMMSATFNDMGHSAGLVMGIVIIVVGHSVNIALSIMGGVIHGLRLNFLEWYRHCFEGGGKVFKPLKLIIRD